MTSYILVCKCRVLTVGGVCWFVGRRGFGSQWGLKSEYTAVGGLHPGASFQRDL